MSVWGAIAGGFAGTLVLTTALRAANELNLTRMDLPFLLGTAFSSDRTRAKALGYILHFLAGLVFALIYYAIFLAIGRSGWWLGAIFGLVHGLFSGTALVNILLPLIHPRMGTPSTAAPSVALLEPPGLHDAQLRSPNPARQPRRPRRVRDHCRRLHLPSRLKAILISRGCHGGGQGPRRSARRVSCGSCCARRRPGAPLPSGMRCARACAWLHNFRRFECALICRRRLQRSSAGHRRWSVA